ncbi:MAG: hypothetical protein J6A43_02870 [Clostridia bacterium]|nr:hypothetical protein [Clostridia bacterium]
MAIMKNFRRVIFSISFSLLMFFTISVTTLAADTDTRTQNQYDCFATSLDNISGEVDIPALEIYLQENVLNCVSDIDISHFNIPYSTENFYAISDYIYDDLIEAFHVRSVSFSYTIGEQAIFRKVKVYYKSDYTKEVYAEQLEQCRIAAEKIIVDIADNPNLTDAEKLLLIHDRLIVLCEYDYDNYLNNTIPDDSYTIYGLLVNGTAVCQGYSETFKYLAKKIGIPTEICTSKKLGHAWNVVYLDGIPYHVDVTFDDPVRDVTGRVFHNNFLLSDEAIKESNHNADDYFVGATDTRFENAYWKNSATQIIYLDNEFYYIDENDEKLVKKSDESVVLDLDYNWSDWVGNYSMLTTDGKYIYYSTPDSIYKYNTKTKTSVEIFNLDTQQNKNQLIYGFTYKNGVFFYDLSTSPNYSSSTLKQLSFKYDETSDIPTDPTLIEIDGILYYYNNAEIDYSETLVFYKNQWYYVNNGRFQDTYTGLVNYYNVWYYVENGILNWNYTGLTLYYDVWYYVENGVLNWNYTGLAYHYVDWYYIENGVLNWNYTGLTLYYDVWYYVENGVLNWNYTGLVYHYGGWYYAEKGVLNWNYTGLTLYYDVWYYVENGVLNWNYTGLTLYYDVWYYVENGILNWNYTGYTNYYGTWYYVENGYLDWSKQ